MFNVKHVRRTAFKKLQFIGDTLNELWLIKKNISKLNGFLPDKDTYRGNKSET